MRVNYIFKENELNKILKKQRNSNSRVSFLFVSPWDKNCVSLVKLISKRYGIENAVIKTHGDDLTASRLRTEPNDNLADMYIIDSFITPHTFVIFKIKKTPTLVTLDHSGVQKEDYLPLVYRKI